MNINLSQKVQETFQLKFSIYPINKRCKIEKLYVISIKNYSPLIFIGDCFYNIEKALFQIQSLKKRNTIIFQFQNNIHQVDTGMRQQLYPEVNQLEPQNTNNHSFFDVFFCCSNPGNLDIEDQGPRIKTSQENKFQKQQEYNIWKKQAVKNKSSWKENQLTSKTVVTEDCSLEGNLLKKKYNQSLPSLRHSVYNHPRPLTQSIMSAQDEEARRQSLPGNFLSTANQYSFPRQSKVSFTYCGKNQQVNRQSMPYLMKVSDLSKKPLENIPQNQDQQNSPPITLKRLYGQKELLISLQFNKKSSSSGSSPKLGKLNSKHFNNSKVRQTVSIKESGSDDSDHQSVVLSRSELEGTLWQLIPIRQVQKESIMEDSKTSILPFKRF